MEFISLAALAAHIRGLKREEFSGTGDLAKSRSAALEEAAKVVAEATIVLRDSPVDLLGRQ